MGMVIGGLHSWGVGVVWVESVFGFGMMGFAH